MSFTRSLCLATFSALALGACAGGGEEEARQSVYASGSSTVYPFSVAVAEAVAQADPEAPLARIESTGTGEGIAQFCAGAGLDTPDIANASRRMTRAEYDTCQANGVGEIVELQVGLDGIAFVSQVEEGLQMNLTPRIVYMALAAEPFGEEQTATLWSDVDPSLPAEAITVYGPPATSGTRDALKELILETGCATNSQMAALRESDPQYFTQLCDTLRTDSAYIDQGERDDVIVRKVAGNPRAIGVFGYSYLEENDTLVKGLPVSGVEPAYDTIASSEYPAARPLYIYVKKAHLETVPGLRPHLDQWVRSWGQDGPLAQIGLVASSQDIQLASANTLRDLAPMSADTLE